MATPTPVMPEKSSNAPAAVSKLSQRPWLAFLLMLALLPVCMAIAAAFLYVTHQPPKNLTDFGSLPTAELFAVNAILAWLLVPWLLRLPNGRRTFRGYLDDIRLTKVRPFIPLLVLTVSCDLILIACQGSGSIVYRLTEGKPVTTEFVRQVFNLAAVLPPKSILLFAQMFSALEEVAFRGVLLTMLLRKYSTPMAIIGSAAVFGLMHLPGVFVGNPVQIVLGQVIWAFLFGLFYGYLFVKSGSLLPCMVIHWLSNVFQAPLTAYWGTAPTAVRAIYGVVFGYGLAAVLGIIWVSYFSKRWLPNAATVAKEEIQRGPSQ